MQNLLLDLFLADNKLSFHSQLSIVRRKTSLITLPSVALRQCDISGLWLQWLSIEVESLELKSDYAVKSIVMRFYFITNNCTHIYTLF